MLKKTGVKKDKARRDFGPHNSRVRETSNKELVAKLSPDNVEVDKELKRRGAHPDQPPVKRVNQGKKAAARDLARDIKMGIAERHAQYSGDARKMK